VWGCRSATNTSGCTDERADSLACIVADDCDHGTFGNRITDGGSISHTCALRDGKITSTTFDTNTNGGSISHTCALADGKITSTTFGHRITDACDTNGDSRSRRAVRSCGTGLQHPY
jgi:hypothetical protein